MNGRIDGTKYFVGSHGRFTEVTHAQFQASEIHAISLFITVLLALVGFIHIFKSIKSGVQAVPPIFRKVAITVSPALVAAVAANILLGQSSVGNIVAYAVPAVLAFAAFVGLVLIWTQPLVE